MRAAPWLRTPALAVVLAAAAAIGLRLVAMQSATAPARDALRYLHAAKTLPELKLTDWLQLVDAHPLYPAALWAGHAAYVAAGAEDGPWAWIRAGQWIGIASQICWLLAAYSIGARLWSPRTAFLGCLLTALLPRTIWYSADLLADSLHAALWTTSLALLVGGWRNGSRCAFLGAGLTAGLAYLTRVEALLLPATALAAGALAMLSPGTNRKRLATGLALFAAGWAATGGPYVAVIGRLSVKNSAAAFTGAPTKSEPADETATPAHFPPVDRTIAGTAMTLLGEFSQETRGWPLPFALLGLAVALRRGKPKAGWAPAAVAFFGGCAMLMLLWQRAGFMAGRLLLPMLPFALFAAAAGLESTGRGLVRTLLAAWPPPAIRRSAFGGVAAVMVTANLGGWVQPLHAARKSTLEAAAWVAANTGRDEPIVDPWRTTAFFAGRRGWGPPGADALESARFMIVESAREARLDGASRAKIADARRRGRLAATFGGDKTSPLVQVFEIGVERVATRGRP